MSGSRLGFGRFAERVAGAFLESRGFEILERNWRCRLGEIDLVARLQDTIVFVEVRAHRGTAMGPAAGSIGPKKRAHLLAAASAYEQAHPGLPPGRRIDVVTIDPGGRGLVLSHIENAIEA